MSRLYDALCQAGLEHGVGPELPLPDLFDSSLPDFPAAAEAKAATTELLSWEKITAFHPGFNPEARLVAMGENSELGSEKFRLLRARLRHLKTRNGIKSCVITSAVPEDGKSLVALNLAISLSKHTQEKILLIEGDLHKPVFAGRTSLTGCQGLGEWLTGDTPIEQHMYRLRDCSLWVVPAGVARNHPLGMLQSRKFLELMSLFRNSFDWILIDAPPLLPLADVNFWAGNSDGVLLVVREGKTPAKLLKKGLETLDSARILGVIFNDAQTSERRYYERYYQTGNPSHSKANE